jgi:hypothetical protein
LSLQSDEHTDHSPTQSTSGTAHGATQTVLARSSNALASAFCASSEVTMLVIIPRVTFPLSN